MKIVDIRRKKEKIEITFDQDKKILISLENYISNPLVIGNDIDNNIIEKILNFDNLINAKKELSKYINKSGRSKKEILDFLQEKEMDKQYIDKIIKDLENQNIIDDDYLTGLLVERSLIFKKGINKIKEDLEKRKISLEITNNVNDYIDKDKYNKNIVNLINKYNLNYKNDSEKLKNKKIENNLYKLGYLKSDFKNHLKEVNFDVQREKDNAANEIKKMIMKDKSKLNLDKIKKKLINRGYNYDIIKIAISEVLKNEIN